MTKIPLIIIVLILRMIQKTVTRNRVTGHGKQITVFIDSL
jgi:hypothetical protein